MLEIAEGMVHLATPWSESSTPVQAPDLADRYYGLDLRVADPGNPGRGGARLGLWWLVFAAWAGPVVAQTPLSFRDALTMTRQQNQQLRAAEAQVQRARAAGVPMTAADFHAALAR